jgi:hypothetical protein
LDRLELLGCDAEDGLGCMHTLCELPPPSPPSLMTNRTAIIGLILLALAPARVWPAQTEQAASIDPTALVRRATQHRIDASRNHRPVRYLLRKTDERHDTTKDIIESQDGDVARLVAINGRPLSAQANQAELDRLNTLANHPEIQEHRHQREQKDADRVNRLMRLLPDAFLYHFEDMAPCAPRRAGAGGGQCYRLSFSPNPHFAPSDEEATIFHGMAGEVWIDRAQERLTRLDAHLIADVDFGWGIIGRLDKGGTILIEQADIGGHDWEVTSLKLNMTGKALMVKSLSFHITEETSDFSLVPPDVDYRKAIQLLEKSGEPIAP